MLHHYHPAGRFRHEAVHGRTLPIGRVPAGTVAQLQRHESVVVLAFKPRRIEAWRREGRAWLPAYTLHNSDTVVCRRTRDGRIVELPYRTLLAAHDDGRTIDPPDGQPGRRP